MLDFIPQNKNLVKAVFKNISQNPKNFKLWLGVQIKKKI